MDHSAEKLQFARLGAGEPAPWFIQRASSSPRYNFSSVGGRYMVLCYFGSAG